MVDTPEINAKLKLNAGEALSLVSEVSKGLKSLKNQLNALSKINIIPDQEIAKVKSLAQQIDSIRRGPKGQFQSLEKSLPELARVQSAWNKELKATTLYFTNLEAAILKTKTAAKNLNIDFGGIEGRVYQQFKTQDRIQKRDTTITSGFLAQAGIDTETQKFAAQTERLNRFLGVNQVRLMANYAAINYVTRAFKSAINYSLQFNEELKQLQAISAVSDVGLKRLQASIEEVASATEFTSLEIAKAATVLAQAGLSVTQIKETLPSIARLATATGTDLATATDVVTSTLNIYELQVTEAVQVTNALTTAMNESKADISGFQTAIQYAGNFAAQLGVTYEETAAVIAAATQAGIRSKSMLGTGLRAVFTEFLKPTKQLIGQLDKVGLKVSDIDVRSKGLTNVLKTLKDAGFGAVEAFRGMERRGAAFLVSIINQVDYIGELRSKMAGSTAAMVANERQMEALNKQIKNLQSNLGTAVYNGIEPLIDGLSSLLAIINKGLRTGAGSLISKVLTGSLTIAGSIAGVIALTKALASMSSAIMSVGKALKAMSIGASIAEFIAYNTAVTAGGEAVKKLTGKSAELVKVLGSGSNKQGIITRTLGYLASIPLGKFTLIATAIIGIGVALTSVAKSMGFFKDKVSEAKAAFEDQLGEADKAQTKYQAVNNALLDFTSNISRYMDDSERALKIRELSSRFPEFREQVQSTTASIDDCVKALSSMANMDMSNTLSQLEEVAKKAKDVAIALGEQGVEKGKPETSIIQTPNLLTFPTPIGLGGVARDLLTYNQRRTDATIQGRTNLIGSLQEKNILTSKQAENLLKSAKAVTDDTQFSKLLQSVILNQTEQAFGNDYKAMSEELKQRIGDLSENASEADKAVHAFVTSIADYASSLDSINKGFIAKEAQEQFGDQITEMAKRSGEVSYQLNELSQGIRNNISEGKDWSEEQIKQRQDLTEEAEKLIEKFSIVNKAKSLKELKVSYEASSVDAFAEKLRERDANITEEAIVKAFKEVKLGDIQKILGNLTVALDNFIEQTSPEGTPRGGSESSYRLLESSGKKLQQVYKNTRSSDTDKEKATQDYIKAYLNNKGIQLKALELEESKRTSTEKSRILEAELAAESLQKLGVSSRNSADAAELLAERMRLATDNLTYLINASKGAINKAEAIYKDIIFREETPIREAKARSEAADQIYGSDSIIAQTFKNQAEITERSLNYDEQNLLALKNLKDVYTTEQERLRNQADFKGLQDTYNKAIEKLKAAQDTGDSKKIILAQKSVEIAAKNFERFSSIDQEWSEKINNINTKITSIEELQKLRKEKAENESSLFYGMGKGLLNYQQKLGLEDLSLAESMAKMTSAGFEQLESSASDAFSAILAGTKKSGDAFKEMGRTVIETMRDIVVQQATKQFMALMLGTTDEKGNSSSGWIQTGIKALFGGAAQGGLITGPVKNRDSVPTMLMPGEYVMKKSAVDTLGRDYLDNLNSNASTSMEGINSQVQSALTTDTPSEGKASGDGIVNVYVVSQGSQSQMGPKDVLVTISNDILTGGQTKKLIKQVAMGGI